MKNSVSSPLHPTLLFVTDFSEASTQALKWAIPEAKQHHLHVSVLFPYRLDQLKSKDNTVLSKKDLDREAAERFESEMEGTLRNGEVSFDFHSEVGFMRDRILEHARKSNVVMLVMGQQMASAESFPELMEDLNIPVVIVPRRKG